MKYWNADIWTSHMITDGSQVITSTKTESCLTKNFFISQLAGFLLIKSHIKNALKSFHANN